MRTLFRTAAQSMAALVVATFTVAVGAATVTYSFETPIFTLGETTPITGAPPNIGPTSFLANFTGTNFQVTGFAPNVLFSGQSLFEPLGTMGPLTISFNTPVTDVSLVFAVNNTTAGGTLTLMSAAGNDTVGATLVGGLFAGGTLAFSSSTPFTSFQLSALGASGAPVEFAIDDVTLTLGATVAEPSTNALVAVALVLAARMRRRRIA